MINMYYILMEPFALTLGFPVGGGGYPSPTPKSVWHGNIPYVIALWFWVIVATATLLFGQKCPSPEHTRGGIRVMLIQRELEENVICMV